MTGVIKIETYYIWEDSYIIEKGDCFNETEEGFSVWRNGCKINSAKTIEEARSNLFSYCMKQLKQEQEKLETKLTSIKQELKYLGQDVFNLGIFRCYQ